MRRRRGRRQEEKSTAMVGGFLSSLQLLETLSSSHSFNGYCMFDSTSNIIFIISVSFILFQTINSVV